MRNVSNFCDEIERSIFHLELFLCRKLCFHGCIQGIWQLKRWHIINFMRKSGLLSHGGIYYSLFILELFEWKGQRLMLISMCNEHTRFWFWNQYIRPKKEIIYLCGEKLFLYKFPFCNRGPNVDCKSMIS